MDSKIKDTPLDYKPNLDWIDEIVRPKRARPNTDTYNAKLLIRLNNFAQSGAPSKFACDETKTPVVIKNIGQMKHAHLRNALGYALKNTDSKLAYTQWFDQNKLKDILEEWKRDFDVLKDCNEAMHLVFSLKEKPDELVMHGLLHATFETLRTCMPDYKFALVPHSHQQHAHIHCFINKTNQITRKRLRFAKRTDCKEFFHDLREEFSYRINAYLKTPEHLYTNQPSLKVLDNLKERLRTIREEEKQAEKDFSSQQEHYNQQTKKLLDMGYQAIERQHKRHSEQKEALKAWQDYTDVLFEKQTRGFTLLQKKQAIYEQYQHLDKRYLDKKTLMCISELKSQIEMQRTTQERNFINPNFLDHIAQALNHQKPTLKNLKRHFYKLNTLEHIIPQLKEASSSAKDKQLAIIHSNQQTLLNIANERLAFLVQRFDALQQEKEDLDHIWNEWAQQLKQATTQKEQENLLLSQDLIKNNRSLARTSKSLSCIAREILSANRFLNNHAKDLPFILQDAKQLLQKLKTERGKASNPTMAKRQQWQTQSGSTLKSNVDLDQPYQAVATQQGLATTENSQETMLHTMMQMMQEQQKTIQTMAQDIAEFRQQQQRTQYQELQDQPQQLHEPSEVSVTKKGKGR
ncbi:hypothetical protein [Helicobacter suis]|uniref:hypothetical protein n=1 Tax=Helicobacter suis TaxID=104628 RepID=UPI0013D07921|nr:hypothetical protein [Helicobacter suis]